MSQKTQIDRRGFVRHGAMAATAGVLGELSATVVRAEQSAAGEPAPKRIKVGVIGCGSVSGKYLPHLSGCPFAELVSTCDIIPERARRAAARFKVANHYPHIDKMLSGAPLDLMVNLTDMQEHYRLSKRAAQAGKHVWSEKPIAGDYAEGQELLELAGKKGVRIWGAPTVVNSPQFAFMAQTLSTGKLGRVAAAHASYGHLGPDWSSFFYEKGGGSMPDLGVYNLTTLTGLLGPARAVVAMTSIITPTRKIARKGEIKVEAEDNAMVMIDHGGGVPSHVQCGFNYFTLCRGHTVHEHDYTRQDHHTISIIGTGGSMHLAGYDWAPHAVDLASRDHPGLKRYAGDSQGYCWEGGASHVAECLATGKESLIRPEHAVHVAEIMAAARDSQRTGRRITIRSSFKWPVIA